MDLKVAGMSLVGNICQKFEAVCQEVDDIVNHDTIKYIENQVMNVGDNVMRFYSDLVQDLVTHVVDPARHEAAAVIQRGNAAISSSFESTLGAGEDFADVLNTQSSMERAACEQVKNQFVHASGDHEQVNEQDLSVSDEGLQETVSKLVGVEKDTDKNCDSSVKEIVIMESVASGSEFSSSDKKEQFEASLYSELADNNHEKECGALGCVQAAASVSNAMFKLSPTIGAAFATSASDAFGSSSEAATICDSFEVNTDRISHASSASSSSAVISTIVTSSAISCKKTTAEMGNEISSIGMPNEACTTSTNASENLSTFVILLNNSNPIDAIGFNSDSFSSLIDSRWNKVMEVESASCSSSSALSMESYDEDGDASGVQETVALIGSSTNWHVQSGSSDNCSCETIVLDKEATKLSHQVKKLEDSHVVIDCNPLHSVSCAAQKLCSYKKKIHDALASKKKLGKEYEQLAILHGNNAMQCCQGSLPASSTMQLDLRNSQTIQFSDSEWELI